MLNKLYESWFDSYETHVVTHPAYGELTGFLLYVALPCMLFTLAIAFMIFLTFR